MTFTHALSIALASSIVATVNVAPAQTTRPVAGPSFDETMLRPLCTVSMIPPPSVDGVIDGKGEYTWGPALNDFVSLNDDDANGVAFSELTYCYLGYDETNLYIAFRMDMPEGVAPKITVDEGRDFGFDLDDCFDILLAPESGSQARRWRIGGNAAGVMWDAEEAEGASINWNWNPKIVYKTSADNTGWRGEFAIPWSELGVSCPKVGEAWRANFIARRRSMDRAEAWSYWRREGDAENDGHLVFGARERGYFKSAQPLARGFSYHTVGALTYYGKKGGMRFVDADVQFRISRRDPQAHGMRSFYREVYSAPDPVAAVRGVSGTYEAIPELDFSAQVKGEMPIHVGYGTWGHQIPFFAFDKPGEYLLQYYITDRSDPGAPHVVAGAARTFRVNFGITAEVWPHLLTRKSVIVRTDMRALGAKRAVAARLVARITAPGQPDKVMSEATAECKNQVTEEVEVPAGELPNGSYDVHVEIFDSAGASISAATTSFKRGSDPQWWVDRARYGATPKVPPPWTPVEASDKVVKVLGRKYRFESLAIPAQIETRDQEILAGPIELRTSRPWEKSTLGLVKSDEESAVYESTSVAGGTTVKVTTRVEFDGFMYIDLDLTGSVELDKLDLVIPLKKEHAVLMQNYYKASGPGDGAWKNPNGDTPYKVGRRFVGFVPDYLLQTPPMMTTWIGTDHYGLEWSCESSRGWAMAKPDEAMEVSRDGDKVLLSCHLISKPVKLAPDKPRHIRFGLVATPTKTIMPYVMKARFYDDISIGMDFWGEYPAWTPPIKDPNLIEKLKKRVIFTHESGAKCVLYGGWNVSMQDPGWETWGREMVSQPLMNVSFSTAVQSAACWNSPFAAFMTSSYAHNAKLVNFDGIRFDTVVPPYECMSEQHGCAWRDDDGKLWPSGALFSQREAWKRFYRTFHGGEVNDGIIYTPNAAGPLMAVHSFSDHHEIGEGYYMSARTIKDAYPPDMVRANMNGAAYGFRAENNLKGSPLLVNHRMTALLVHGMEGRMGDYRSWRPGYEGHGNPAPGIWDAWDWVDRWSATFKGYWENRDYVHINAGAGQMVMASFWHHPEQKKVLLVVGNYEIEPRDDLEVKLDLAKLGFSGEVYGEDAITSEPVPISSDGTLKLELLGERYRLVKISPEKPQYRSEALGPDLVTGDPGEIETSWTSPELKLEPDSTYVLKAQLKIEQNLSKSPTIDRYIAVRLRGDGVRGVLGTHARALPRLDDGKPEPTFVPIVQTSHYQQNCVPQLWEKTPGWYTVFVPFATGEEVSSGAVNIEFANEAQGIVKDVSLQKLR